MYLSWLADWSKHLGITALSLSVLLHLPKSVIAQSITESTDQAAYQLFQSGITTAVFDQRRAEPIWREMIRRMPSNTVGYYYLGLSLAHQGQHEAAETAYREVIRLNAAHAMAHYNLSRALTAQNQTAAAATAMRAAVNLYTNDAAAHCDLANTLTAQFRIEEAIAATQNALLVDTDYAFMQAQGMSAVCDLHRFEQTADILAAATALYPNNAEWPYRLGAVLDRQQQWEAAIAAYQTAIDRDPNYANAYLRMSASLTRLGNDTAAAAAKQAATQVN